MIILLQKQENGINTWKAGMRLEALDRETPTLICVATVGMMTNFLYSMTLNIVTIRCQISYFASYNLTNDNMFLSPIQQLL